MNIKITKPEASYLNDCADALHNSELGRVYFPCSEKAVQAVKEGMAKEEIEIALSEDGTCLGFLWIINNGAFHSFPYLHIIAVKEEYRGRGIGRKLLEYIEETAAAKNQSKLFLVVADFNPRAKQLYESIGYHQIGIIPDLYKKGVTEYLMMKELSWCRKAPSE